MRKWLVEPTRPFEQLHGAGELIPVVPGRQPDVQHLLRQILDEGEASFVLLDQNLVTIE